MVRCNKCEKVLNKDNSGYLSVGIMLCLDCSESFFNIDDDEEMTLI